MWKVTTRYCRPFNPIAPFGVAYCSSEEERDALLAAARAQGDYVRVDLVSPEEVPRPPAIQPLDPPRYEWHGTCVSDCGLHGARRPYNPKIKPAI